MSQSFNINAIKGRPYHESNVDILGNLRVLDERDGLRLIHYVDEPSSFEMYDAQFRGKIIDNEDKIVCVSHPHTQEFSMDSYDGDVVKTNSERSVAVEGTMLRVYFYNGKWNFSTYKKIEGSKSRWGKAKPFKTYFDELFGDVFTMLDQNYCYSFLLCHKETKIVMDVDESHLLYVIKWNIPEQKFESIKDDQIFDDWVHVKKPNFLVNGESTNSYDGGCGYLITHYMDDGSILCEKYLDNDYFEKRNIRGNEPNLRIAYFNACLTDDREKFAEITNDRRDEIISFNEELEKLVPFVQNLYQKRFIDGAYCVFPPKVYVVINKINKEYRNNYNIDSDVCVTETLRLFDGRVINALVNFMKKTEKENELILLEKKEKELIEE